jgi:crossover junction endodeoxyribonuclease RuvC
LAERLAFLHAGVARVLREHRPEQAVVERVFGGRSVRSALVLGQARGAVLAALAGARLPVRELSAQHVKLAVAGTGAAEKAQVQAMVRRLLALAQAPPRDAADALAAAICGAHATRLSVLHQGHLDRVGPRSSGRARGREAGAGSRPSGGERRRWPGRVVVRRLT